MLAKTSWKVTTRISEHQKKGSTVGKHLVECCGTAHYIEWEILDTTRGVEELMTMEAIYIKKLKPKLKTRNKFWGGNWHWSVSCNPINFIFEVQKIFMLVQVFVNHIT